MKRTWLKWALLAALVAVVAAVVGGRAIRASGQGEMSLAGTPVCTTCLSVAGPSTPPVLYPDASPSPLAVALTNRTNGPLYVTSLSVTLTNSWQPGCQASEFQLSGQSFASSTATVNFTSWLLIPANSTITDNETLSMLDDHSNQNGCAGQSLGLSYTGTASYTLLTTTTLATSVNASGDTATLSATVAPDISPASAAVTPGPGDGSVTFYECSSSTSAGSCTGSLGSSSLNSSGIASLTIPASSVGSYNYVAVFTSSDQTNYVKSSSTVVTQSLSGCVAVPTAGAGTIITGTSSGNYEVKSGTSVWLDGGTITGNVTVDAGGQFAATGGTITGNLQSSSGPVAISGTSVRGNVQTQGGGLSLGPSTSIGGNAQAQGGGPLCSEGSATAPVQVKGNLLGQSLTSSIASSVCATNVGNNLQWLSNGSPVTLGVCGPNTILGNLQVQTNSGKVTVGAVGNGNATTGNIIVQNNTGGGTLGGNSATGNCLLSGDKPGIVGTSNTAKGANNQCDTGAAGA